MSFSKAHRFDPSDYHFSLLCKALSHPARICVVRKIITHDNEKLPAGELTSNLPILRPAVSAHLKILRDMHILRCEGLGPQVSYWLNPDLPNTYWGIVHLMVQTGIKFDERYSEELPLIGSRRIIGTAPF